MLHDLQRQLVWESRRKQKLTHHKVRAAKLAMPSFLRWSDSAITYDRSDHPEYVPCPVGCSLVVDPIVGTKRLTKLLMDGGSGLNIMYSETLDAIGVNRSRIRPSGAPFHIIMPGKQVVPIGQIDLPVTFWDRSNFKTKTLTFEVVDFRDAYHAIFGAAMLCEVHGGP